MKQLSDEEKAQVEQAYRNSIACRLNATEKTHNRAIDFLRILSEDKRIDNLHYTTKPPDSTGQQGPSCYVKINFDVPHDSEVSLDAKSLRIHTFEGYLKASGITNELLIAQEEFRLLSLKLVPSKVPVTPTKHGFDGEIVKTCVELEMCWFEKEENDVIGSN
jgi:hypothetical protein